MSCCTAARQPSSRGAGGAKRSLPHARASCPASQACDAWPMATTAPPSPSGRRIIASAAVGVVLVELGDALLLGLALDGGLLVGLARGRERVAGGVGAALAVRGVLDELILGELEALGLPAAGLVDRLHRLVAVGVVQARAADAARLGGRGRLLGGDEVVVGV